MGYSTTNQPDFAALLSPADRMQIRAALCHARIEAEHCYDAFSSDPSVKQTMAGSTTLDVCIANALGPVTRNAQITLDQLVDVQSQIETCHTPSTAKGKGCKIMC